MWHIIFTPENSSLHFRNCQKAKRYKVMDTGNENGFLEKEMKMDAVQVEIAGMSIQILIGK